MNKVIITGATSMLGLALLNECIAQNVQVVALVRKNSARQNILPKSQLLTIIECDLSEFRTVNLPKNADVFYHFAWTATQNKERNIVDEHNKNIQYTLDAVNAAFKSGCKKFVGAGSQAEYGRYDGIASTEMRVLPDSAYGVAKYAAGKLSAILCEQLGMEHVWTRIFSTYGINDMPSTMIMYLIHALLKGEKPQLTKCEQQWDYLNCKDAAKAFYLLGTSGKNQSIYHIGSGVARPLSEYVYAIRNAIDPALPLGIGEKEYAPKQVMQLCPDISSLTNDTGFKPTIPFEQGIKETIEWCKGQSL